MGNRKKSERPNNPANDMPNETHLKAGMLAMSFMGYPALPEEELLKRAKMAEEITGK